MTRTFIFKFDGNLHSTGCRVSLEIARAGKTSMLAVSGFLPAVPELERTVREHWEQKYRSLGERFPRRIKTKRMNFQGSIQQRLEECRDSAEELRERLNDWLNSESFQKIDRHLREELNRTEPIQFLIRSDDLELKKLPWHLWDAIARFPNVGVAVSSLEYGEAQLPKLRRKGEKVRILAILGYSEGLDLEPDRQLLLNLPGAETEFLIHPKRKEINDRLWEKEWDIIFFAGHGSTENGEGRIEINPQESLSLTDLWYGLRKAADAGLQLAIFNSCDGLGLLADGLDDCQIPYAIVMRDLVPDEVAQEFLRVFLTAFSRGKSLHLAEREARERLQGLEDRYPCASWLPTIWQNPTALPFNWLPEVASQPRQAQWKKVAAAIAILTIGGAIGYLGLGSHIASWANAQGLISQRQNQRLSARRYYQLAMFFAPDWPKPYYNLATLYEDQLGDRESALTLYLQSLWRGLPEGAAEVARLSLLKGDPDTAYFALSTCLKETPYQALRAACLKNRGLMYWKQGRLLEAEGDLKGAIALESDSPQAYCFLAQVLEARKKRPEARQAWQNTLRYAQPNHPESEQCIGLAHQRLTDFPP